MRRIELIDKFKKEFTVKLCCLILDVARSTYYANQKKISLTEKYDYLKKYLEEIIKDSPFYGYRRIKDALKNEHNQVINHKPLLKLLKDWNLALKRKVKKKRRSGIEGILKEMGSQVNILKTLNEDEIEPFTVFQTDFTEIHVECGKIYLMPYVDFKSKIIAGYSISLNANTETAKEAYKNLKIFLGEKGVKTDDIIIHQDQGKPYTSYEYVEMLMKDNVIPSYSKVGTPGDNAGMESLFGRLKDEKMTMFETAKNIEELIELVTESIKYYNHNRIHSKTNGKSPIDNLPTIWAR